MDPAVITRFDGDLSRLLPEGGRFGVAVSGGPDSLALLLLAAAARPGEIEAATVNHSLRPESTDEARIVADACGGLGVPHATLTVAVPPGASLQAQARDARYAALAKWANQRGLTAILTAHHADDQAETLLMRLSRGSGLAGLSGVRARTSHFGAEIVRPFLGWRKQQLEAIVAQAGITAVTDPSNQDPRHDRTRTRAFLATQDWLDPERLAASASHLAEAEEALGFAAAHAFAERHSRDGEAICLRASGLPNELQRRLLLLCFSELSAATPRGPDVDRALTTLKEGGTCTLSNLQLSGGPAWRIAPAPPRR